MKERDEQLGEAPVSQTHRTDAERLNHSFGVVDIDFARQLERELNAAQATLDRTATLLTSTLIERDEARAENAALCAFINREMQMTANDPRIEELKRLMANTKLTGERPSPTGGNPS
jgi:hypothetical protein